MDAISKLGLDIDTTGIARGAVATDRLASSTDRAEREAGQLENRSRRLTGQMGAMGGVAGDLARQLAAAFSVWAVIRANDAWTSATNQLRLVTDSARELRDMTREVFDLSQRTASSFTGTAGLYASIQRAAGQAIGSQQEVLRLTETIMKLTQAGGGPQGSRDAALFQLRQAMSGVVLQAQEYNSLVDGAPLLVQALADSLGVTRAELRAMVLDQRVQIRDMISGLQGYADEADALFSRVNFTMADAFVRLQNAFQKLVGTNLGPVFSALVNGVSFVAENLDALIPIISGVGVALAIAFTPTVVTVFAGAIAALFSLIAANPIAAFAGAVTALVVAMHQFGEEVVVASARVSDFTKTASEEARAALESTKDFVDVTLTDVVNASFQMIGEAAQGAYLALRDGVSQAMGGIEEAGTKTEDFWQLLLSDAKAVINGVIQMFVHMLFVITSGWETVSAGAALAWANVKNSAIDAMEAVANFVQDNASMQGRMLPDIELGGRVDTSELERRFASLRDMNSDLIEQIYRTDYVGALMEPLMERARALAVIREEATTQAEAEAAAAAAAAAAADAAGRNADKLRDQMRARQAMFDDLEAQLRLTEREYDIYRETEDLLRRFPEYYQAIAAGAEDVAAAARQAADQDARSLASLRQRVAAMQSLRTMASDRARLATLTEGASISADELELRERTLDLLQQHSELYQRLGASAYDTARAEAQRQLTAERTLDTMTEQAERARDIAQAPLRNLSSGLEDIEENFWNDFRDNGFDAIDNLGDAFSNLFRQLQVDILRDLLNPLTTGIRQAIVSAVSGGGGGGFNLGSIFSNIFGGGGIGGKGGGGGFSLGSIFSGGSSAGGGGGFNLGSLFGGGGGLGGLWDALGGLFPGGGIGGGLGGASAHAGGQIIGGGLGGLSGILGTALQGFAISQIGTGIAAMLGFDGKGAGVGGTIGGIAGSFLGGPIGSAIGSFIGSAIGDLIGPNESSYFAYQKFGPNNTATGSVGGKPNDQSAALVQQASARISEGLGLVEQLGGTFSAYVDSIGLMMSKRNSTFWLRDKATGQLINGGHDNDVYGPGTGFSTNSSGDANDLASDTLKEMLRRATFDNPVLETVKNAMLAWRGGAVQQSGSNGGGGISGLPGLGGLLGNLGGLGSNGSGPQVEEKTFEEILEVLGSLAEVLPPTEEATSQWKVALEKLDETFTKLHETTAGVTGVTEQLDQAYQEAKDYLKNQFSEGIEDAIAQIENPVKLAFEDLLETQALRLQDAAALGADVARVMHLNELELQGFIEQAGGSATAFASLNAVFDELIAKAAAAGNATQPLIDAYNQARSGVVSAFDNDVAQQMANLSNPTLGALKALLDAQKARLDQARAIGANIVAVERLNAMEQRAFFESLSDEQRAQLAAHLGLIEDFTGRIAVVLGQLGDELNQRINETEAMRTDLLRQSDAMRDLAENLAQTRQGIVDRYGAMTPQAGVEALRERLSGLMDEARGGNDSALNAIGQVGQQLIEASRSLYGSTSTFRGDYDLVTRLLEEAQGLASDRSDALASEAETLIQQRDLLIEIRDLLSEPDPALDILQLRLDQLDQNQDEVAGLLAQYLALSAQQAGQNVNLADLYQQATNAAAAPSLGQTVAVTPATAGAVNTTSTNGAGSGASAPTTSAGATTPDAQAASMIAVLIDATNQNAAAQQEQTDELRREVRRLGSRLDGFAQTAN